MGGFRVSLFDDPRINIDQHWLVKYKREPVTKNYPRTSRDIRK